MINFSKWTCALMMVGLSTSVWGESQRLSDAIESGLKGVKLGGYFDTEWKSAGKVNTFVAHRLVLFTTAIPHPSIVFNTEIEFEYGGAVNNLGDSGEIKIEQAWLDYKLSDQAIVRTGIVLVPFGKLNILHDSEIRETTNRPLMTKYVVPTTWMDTGVGVHGAVDIADWEVNYSGYLLNGLISAPSITAGIRSARPNFKSDNNQGKAFAGHIAVLPSIQTEIGASLYMDTMTGTDTVDGTFQMYGLDFLQKEGIFELAGEWALSEFKHGTPIQQDGYFLEGRVSWLPDFVKGAIGATQFDNPSMTWFARYSEVDLNRGGSVSKAQRSTTLGFNYRPIESLAFKLEYEINRGDLTEANTDAIYGSIAYGF